MLQRIGEKNHWFTMRSQTKRGIYLIVTQPLLFSEGNEDLLVIHAWLFSHYYIYSLTRKASSFIYLLMPFLDSVKGL